MQNSASNNRPFNNNELVAADTDFKQFVSPQRVNIAKDYLGLAEESMVLKDVNSANQFMKKFGDISGFAVKDLDKSSLWFGNPYVKNNLKYIRDVSLKYNMNTIKNYMYEAERRGLRQQVKRYQELLQIAKDTSITEEAAIEVSAQLDKMVSRMKYIDSPSGITQLDLAKFSDIKKKYSIDKESLDRNTEMELNRYSEKVKQGFKDVAGGFLGTLLSVIDLTSSVVTLTTGKEIPSLNNYLMEKAGVKTNSLPYIVGELATFAFGGELVKAVSMIKEKQGLAKALQVFNKNPSIGGSLSKLIYAGSLHLSGKAVGAGTYKVLDNFDISEARKTAASNVAGAVGMLGTHKAYNWFNSGGSGGQRTIGTGREPLNPDGTGGEGSGKPTGGSGGGGLEIEIGGRNYLIDLSSETAIPQEKALTRLELPRWQQLIIQGRSKVLGLYKRINDLSKNFIDTFGEYIYGTELEKTIINDNIDSSVLDARRNINTNRSPEDSTDRKLINETLETEFGTQTSPSRESSRSTETEFGTQASPSKKSYGFTTTINGEVEIPTPTELKSNIISSMEKNPNQGIEGQSFEGAYIKQPNYEDGEPSIENVNAYNLKSGAENVSNYDTKIDSTGGVITAKRKIEDVADVIDQQSLIKLSKVHYNEVERPDSALEIESNFENITVNNADEAVNKLLDLLTTEQPISEFDARNMERGISDIIVRLLRSEEEEIRAIGTAAFDVLSYISLGVDKNAMLINEYFRNAIQAKKDSIFNIVGIVEGEIDLTRLKDKGYTGEIAKSAISEIKNLINNKFSPDFENFKQKIDSFSALNPEATEIALGQIREVIAELKESGVSLAKGTKDLYYENILRKIAGKAYATKFQEIPQLINNLLNIEISEDTKGISGVYRTSLGERLMLVRRYLRTAAQMYETDTVKGFDASAGAFGDYITKVYKPIDNIINNLMKDVLGEEYSRFEEVNSEYAQYARTRSEIYKVITDPTMSGDKIWKALSNKLGLVRRLLSHASGETIKAGSNISKFRQLLMAELLRPILNIDPNGEVIFNLTGQKQLDFGRISEIKSLLNEEQIRLLNEASVNTSVLADYQRYRNNNSRTADLSDIRRGLSNKTLPQQIEMISKSDNVVSGVRLIKNIAKVSKKAKIKSLSKGAMLFNSIFSLVKGLAEDVVAKETSEVLARIVHIIIDPAMESLILSKSAKRLKNRGYYDSPYNTRSKE